MHLKAKLEFGSEFFNSLHTGLNLSTSLTQQVVYWSKVPHICFSQPSVRNQEAVFPPRLCTYCYGLTDVFVERRGFGTRLCIPRTGTVSLQNGSVDERERVRGKAHGNQSVVIAVTSANFQDWTQKGTRELETPGDEELKSFCHYPGS